MQALTFQFCALSAMPPTHTSQMYSNNCVEGGKSDINVYELYDFKIKISIKRNLSYSEIK